MTRVRKEPQERTAEILQKAKTLFDMFGYQKVTMSDIGEACSLARSSIYEYYPNKEAIAVELLSGLSAPFVKISIRGKKLEKRLANFAEDTLKAAAQNLSLLSLFFNASPGFDAEKREQATAWQQLLLNKFQIIFQEEKKLRLTNSRASYFALGLLLQRISDMALTRISADPEEDGRLIAEFIVKGVN